MRSIDISICLRVSAFGIRISRLLLSSTACIAISLSSTSRTALTVAELSTEQECYDAQVIVANESPNPSAVFICFQQVETVAKLKG